MQKYNVLKNRTSKLELRIVSKENPRLTLRQNHRAQKAQRPSPNGNSKKNHQHYRAKVWCIYIIVARAHTQEGIVKRKAVAEKPHIHNNEFPPSPHSSFITFTTHLGEKKLVLRKNEQKVSARQEKIHTHINKHTCLPQTKPTAFVHKMAPPPPPAPVMPSRVAKQ